MGETTHRNEVTLNSLFFGKKIVKKISWKTNLKTLCDKINVCKIESSALNDCLFTNFFMYPFKVILAL